MDLKINIHSVIDIITNSSTEIFVSANYSSINTIKTLINHFLKLSKSDKTCDDLFEISINSEGFNEYLEKECGIDTSIDIWKDSKYNVEELYKNYCEYEQHNDWGAQSSIYVKTKVEDNEAKEIAHILSNLESLFESEIIYC